MQFGPVGDQPLTEFGLVLWGVDHAERYADLADLGDIGVGDSFWKRCCAVALSGSKETVGLGAVDPHEQVGIEGGVLATVASGAVDPGVDRFDLGDDLVGFLDRAEGRGAGKRPVRWSRPSGSVL